MEVFLVLLFGFYDFEFHTYFFLNVLNKAISISINVSSSMTWFCRMIRMQTVSSAFNSSFGSGVLTAMWGFFIVLAYEGVGVSLQDFVYENPKTCKE